MVIPEIDNKTGEVIFPEIPSDMVLTHTQYTPSIDERSGRLQFPPIKQDNDSTYVHNVCQTVDEMNTDLEDKPKVILTVGTNAPDEHDENTLEPHLLDYYYTHKLIKQLVEDPDYIPVAIGLHRDEYIYGDTTIIHLNNPRSDYQKFLYEHDIQVTSLLSYLFDDYPPKD